MSYRRRIKKLREARQQGLKKNYFIVSLSKEQEMDEINKIKALETDESLIVITIFKVYE